MDSYLAGVSEQTAGCRLDLVRLPLRARRPELVLEERCWVRLVLSLMGSDWTRPLRMDQTTRPLRMDQTTLDGPDHQTTLDGPDHRMYESLVF